MRRARLARGRRSAADPQPRQLLHHRLGGEQDIGVLRATRAAGEVREVVADHEDPPAGTYRLAGVGQHPGDLGKRLGSAVHTSSGALAYRS